MKQLTRRQSLNTPTCRYQNTDLVIVATMRPYAMDDVYSGYARALQRDGQRRVTAALFNWSPKQVDEELYNIEVKDAHQLTVRESRQILSDGVVVRRSVVRKSE